MHPLFGPYKKVDRADERLHAMEKEIVRLLDSERFGIVIAEQDRKTGQHVLRARVSGNAAPFLRWSVDIGEIAHNLRSALDQLAYQLALQANPASVNLFERTAFPIYRFGPRSRCPGKYRWSDKKPAIASVAPTHRALLQRFQPYHRRNGGRLSPLWLLHEINNADKHRLIQLTANIARGMGLIVKACPPDFHVKRAYWKPGVRLVDGAKLGTIDFTGTLQGVDMKLSLEPEIVFWDGCDAVKRLPVVRTLERMVDTVEDIIRRVATEFPPMGPPWEPPE